MTVCAERVDDASIDGSSLDAVRRSTSFARRALRARSAFFWSATTGCAGLASRDGEIGEVDAGALAELYTTEVLAAAGPVARSAPSDLGGPCTFGAVAVRSGDVAYGVLFVEDRGPRAFEAADLDMIDEVGAALARDLERGRPSNAPVPADEAIQPQVPLNAILSLSDAMVRDATSVRSIPAQDYLAAADHLTGVAARLRELAGAQAEAPVPEREGAAPRAGATSGATILLADDLDLNRKLISDMLTIEGHRVDCVADGAAALLAVQQKSYDLVLMDMIMPEMDGIAATRAIRALPAPACRVPIVALTANTFREQLDSCLEAGMDATLTKPMTFDALTRAVEAWARNRTEAA